MKKMIGIKPDNDVFIYYNQPEFEVNKNQIVVVETVRGLQLGVVVNFKEFDDSDVSDMPLNIVRLATEQDIVKNKENIKDASDALINAKKIVHELEIDMSLVKSYYSLDRTQLIFSFTSDNRVDFRELAKRLAQLYKTRIELRQIGVRDKAREVGGIGPCGRFLCCNTFLSDFDSVSINMAKNQFIALNPSKINGVCGRLLCCLKYEDSQYSDLKKGLPQIGSIVNYNGSSAKVISVDIFNRKVMLELPNKNIVEMDCD